MTDHLPSTTAAMRPIPAAAGSRPPLTTSLPRAALALVVGAAAGGGAVVSLVLLLGAWSGGWSDGAGLASELRLGLLTALVVAFVYLIGLGLVGAPSWWLMHRLGLRQWWACALLGAVLNGGVIWALYGFAPEAGRLVGAVVFAAIGAFVGLVIWRVAYRRAAPDYLEVW